MIDKEHTLKKHHNIVAELSRGSQKLVVAVCDGCGKPRDAKFRDYRDLCVQCVHKLPDVRAKKSKSMMGKNTEPHTEEHNQKISISTLGEKNHNFGKPMTEDAKQKLREYRAGRMHTDETKHNMSDVRKGVPKSEEMKSNLRTAKLATHPMRGKHWDIEQRIAFSSGHQKINVDEWGGFVAGIRDHVLPISQCAQINKWFTGCEGHHLSRSLVMFIPAELHNHIWHNMKSGIGMAEMNALALQFAF